MLGEVGVWPFATSFADAAVAAFVVELSVFFFPIMFRLYSFSVEIANPSVGVGFACVVDFVLFVPFPESRALLPEFVVKRRPIKRKRVVGYHVWLYFQIIVGVVVCNCFGSVSGVLQGFPWQMFEPLWLNSCTCVGPYSEKNSLREAHTFL